MSLPRITVQGYLRMPDGTPMVNARVKFALSHTDSDLSSDTVVTPHPVEALTDGNGHLSVDLWSNDRGFQNTHYNVVAIVTEHQRDISYRLGRMQVTENGSTDLEQLLTEQVVRSLGVDEQTLEAALRAEIAAQAAAANAEILDEPALEARLVAAIDQHHADLYEAGVWTPNFGGDRAVASGTIRATYVKVGRIVKARLEVSNVTWAGVAAGVYLTGLPFASDGRHAGQLMARLVDFADNAIQIVPVIENGSDGVFLTQVTDGGVWGILDMSQLTTADYFVLSIDYETGA